MYLYRFEVKASPDTYSLIVAAETDEAAFRLVDVELEKQLLKVPEVQDVTLYEKKRIGKGVGYVL